MATTTTATTASRALPQPTDLLLVQRGDTPYKAPAEALKAYMLSPATAAAIGAIKPGTNLSVDADGTLHAAISGALTYRGAIDPTSAEAPANAAVGDVYLASAAGVAHAFSPYTAGGGTDYGAGVAVLAHHRPAADEDALFVFIGDQQASRFGEAVRKSGLNPAAFAMLQVGQNGQCVEHTATELGIPLFPLDEAIFADPYAVPRTLQRLIASTPVVAAARRTALIDEILATDLLKKPVWA